MSRPIKTIFFWVMIFVCAILLWEVVRAAPQPSGEEITYSRFLSQVEAGNVANVTIGGQEIHGWYRDGGAFRLTGPSNPEVYLGTLQRKNVEIRFRDTQSSSLPLQLLGTWAPLILLGVLWFYMIRQMQRRKQNPPGPMPPGGGTLGPSIGPPS
ncbi:MAG TPA: ATP-dependent metallopeptidase FtsH/Yme1/Tma family protein [Dongiaceae bacterium]|nr:ATP-dependent metallopeptidase FtsH/Yme1/Tma family protein [Dongiaceae bacterium]